MIEAVVLGCGTSHGVPTIGCKCRVCQSDHPRNKRTRSSLALLSPETSILVDCPQELRLQLVREGIETVDMVILTHSHADHIMGMDDLRALTHDRPMPVYAQPAVLDDVRRVFRYVFEPSGHAGGGLPKFELYQAPERLSLAAIREPSTANLEIEVFPVLHGGLEVLALKVGGLAYLTDVSDIPDSAWNRLEGIPILIIDATRVKPHPSHFHLEKAIETAQALGAGRTYLTHLAHDYDYEETNEALPDGIELSYDGLRIPIPPR